MEASYRYAFRRSLGLIGLAALIGLIPFGFGFIPHADGETLLVMAIGVWIVSILMAIAGLMTLASAAWLRVRPPRSK
jgi:hypothetical protein